MTTQTIIQGDCLEELKKLESGSVQCVMTSPPYWGLRDYGFDGQIGLEKTPEEYVANLVAVFREVRRVLKDDGVMFLNLGDSYAANRSYQVTDNKHKDVGNNMSMLVPEGLKPKDLIGIPWRVAFALQADGWWLRQDIIWHKPNAMPESVTDRCTKSHEYVFLLTKSGRYYFDHEAIKEPSVDKESHKGRRKRNAYKGCGTKGFEVRDGFESIKEGKTYPTRNKRDVWTINTKPFKGSHFAVFPEALVEPPILAGSGDGDTVLDPFMGSGTVLAVAKRLNRNAIGIEANQEYIEIARKRLGT